MEPRRSIPLRRRLPPLTTALMLGNLGVYLAAWAAGGTQEPGVLAVFGAKIGPLIREGEWWRLVSHGFLHIGPFHLLVNLYALYLLGSFVERTFGWRRALTIYVASLLGGGLASTALTPALSAGASGAIYGLLGVTLLIGYRNRHRLPQRAQWMFWAWLVPFFVLSLAFSFIWKMIDYWSHLGGLAAGVLVALPWGNPSDELREPRPWSERLATVTAAISILAVLAGMAFAVRSVVIGDFWLERDRRTWKASGIGYEVALPRGWERVAESSTRTEMVFFDGIALQAVVRILPGNQNAQQVRRALEVPDGPGKRLGKTREVVAGGHPARASSYLIHGGLVRRDQYFVSARGLSATLIFETRTKSNPFYQRSIDKAVSSLRLRETPLREGWALLDEGKRQEAVAQLEKALKSDARGLALRALARAHRELRQYDRAVARAREAVRDTPLDPSAQVVLVEALYTAGKKEEAAAVLAGARRVATRNVRALRILAQSALQVGLERQAKRILQDVMSERRNDYLVYNNLAWLLATAKDRRLRNPKKALRLAQAAVEGTRWKLPTFVDTLAEAQFATGKPGLAVATAERALKLDPNDAHLMKQLVRFRRAAQPRAGTAAKAGAPAAATPPAKPASGAPAAAAKRSGVPPKPGPAETSPPPTADPSTKK